MRKDKKQSKPEPKLKYKVVLASGSKIDRAFDVLFKEVSKSKLKYSI